MELHSVCLPVLLLATHPSYPLSHLSLISTKSCKADRAGTNTPIL